MAASRRRAWLLPLIAALVPLPVAASAAAEPSTAQPAPPEQPAPGEPTLSLTLEVRADELRFDAGPDLTVTLGNQAGGSVLVDTCQFASGVTYRDVHLRLEITDSAARLSCDRGGSDAESRPSTDDGEVAVPTAVAEP